jgi:hypothetical protein
VVGPKESVFLTGTSAVVARSTVEDSRELAMNGERQKDE